MFNYSQIMRAAWARYRDIRARYGKWQIERGIIDASFSACLKTEWRIAKADAAKAARQRKIDALLAGSQAGTLRALLTALENVQYPSFRFSASEQRATIERKIEALIGEAA